MPKESMARFKRVRNVLFVLAALFAITILPPFWTFKLIYLPILLLARSTNPIFRNPHIATLISEITSRNIGTATFDANFDKFHEFKIIGLL